MKDYGFTKRDAQRLDIKYAYDRMQQSKVDFINGLIVPKQILVLKDITHPFYHVASGLRFKSIYAAERFWVRRLKPTKTKKVVNPFTGK